MGGVKDISQAQALHPGIRFVTIRTHMDINTVFVEVTSLVRPEVGVLAGLRWANCVAL